MAIRRFVDALAATDFAARYYHLCTRFPQRQGDPGRCTKKDVLALLAELGRVPTQEGKGKAFEFEHPAGNWKTFFGFILQGRELVEFWCSFEKDGEKVGGNFTVLAREVGQMNGLPLPEPPYPRPIFRSVVELRDILAELFKLADLIAPVVVRDLA
jgi:hypothetical protein